MATVSVDANWGTDFLTIIDEMKSSGKSTASIITWMTEADLMPLARDIEAQGEYMRDLFSKNKDKRKAAVKAAKGFDKVNQKALEIVFRDVPSVTERDITMLRRQFENDANGFLATVRKGEDPAVMLQIITESRQKAVRALLRRPAARR